MMSTIATIAEFSFQSRVSDRCDFLFKKGHKGQALPIGVGKWKWFRVGLAETVGAINALWFCSLLIFNSVGIFRAEAIALLFLIAAWVLAAHCKDVS